MWLKPEVNFRKVIETYGYPLISKEVAKRLVEYNNAKAKNKLEQSLAYQEFNGIRKSPCGKSCYNKQKWRFLIDSPYKIDYRCCDIMKKKPSKQFEKETHRKPFLGTMTIESRARKTAWLKHGCNAFESDRPTSCPLSFWTEQDILEYIAKHNLPFASVYGKIIQNSKGKYSTTGRQRTGCVFCGYGAHLEKEQNRFQELKVTHPKLWNYCMKPWDEGGLGMREVLDYIGVDVD